MQGMLLMNNSIQLNNEIPKSTILYFKILVLIICKSKFLVSHLIYNLKNKLIETH